MVTKSLSFGLTEEQEVSFHQYNLPNDVRQASIGVLLIMVLVASFIFNDYQSFGATQEFIWLAIYRIGLIIYSILQIIFMSRLKDYRTYHLSIGIWAMVFVASNLLVDFTRQDSLFVHISVVAIAVFLLYLVIPNKYVTQIVLATAASVGEVLIIVSIFQPSVEMLFTILIVIGMANIIAASSSMQLHAYRRRVFLNVSELSQSEAKVQRNSQTLAGINRILREAVTSRTEEELGAVCLAVAEELTHSKFGFIGELDREGKMDAISISKAGLETCSILKPARGCKVKIGFKAHGLNGKVLMEGEPLIANDPSSHPNSSGLPSGHPSLTSFLGVPLKYKGRIVGMIAVANNEGGYSEVDGRAIEEIAPTIVEAFQRKRAEKLLRESRADLKQAQSVATTGSWRISANGELKWSDETHRIFGIPKGTPMTYGLFIGAIHPDDRDTVDKKWAAALRGEPYDIEHRILVNGEVKWVREKAEMEVNSEGVLLSALGTVQDITDLKLTEEHLKQRTEELARSNAELQQFAYVASHDMQEPLRMVVNYLSLLERKYKEGLDQTAQMYIHYAVDGGQRMRDLIDDLLEYSRVDTRGKEPTPTPMNGVVAETLMILKQPIEENDAEIVVDTLPTILADESQMVQVMQNLVGNAIKFHGPERPKVRISVTSGNGEWIFSVKDNGIGLNMENAGKLFQMFQRLHGRTEYPGTGVGLAIVKKIVERHCGRVWVESEEGKGATFFFTVPMKDAMTARIGRCQ